MLNQDVTVVFAKKVFFSVPTLVFKRRRDFVSEQDPNKKQRANSFLL